jgi:hypothetical protein
MGLSLWNIFKVCLSTLYVFLRSFGEYGVSLVGALVVGWTLVGQRHNDIKSKKVFGAIRTR